MIINQCRTQRTSTAEESDVPDIRMTTSYEFTPETGSDMKAIEEFVRKLRGREVTSDE